VTVRQTKRGRAPAADWDFWKRFDTDERYVNVRSIDEGSASCPLLLKKKVYRSMVGGDGACMGCGGRQPCTS
jgi:pyruvate-ferredoxin/flavodoxin oxidoreductase